MLFCNSLLSRQPHSLNTVLSVCHQSRDPEATLQERPWGNGNMHIAQVADALAELEILNIRQVANLHFPDIRW